VSKKTFKMPVAVVHAHFSIHGTETADGEIAVDESVEAIRRFIRWHERQVGIGRTLLAKFLAATGEPPSADAVDPHAGSAGTPTTRVKGL
jgi:hypothetical protein